MDNLDALRNALANDEAVLIQGDRVMPGQKGQAVRFFGGHILLPTGPVRLALISGAPIIPVYSVRTPEGKIRLFIEKPIVVGDMPGGLSIDEAMIWSGACWRNSCGDFPINGWKIVRCGSRMRESRRFSRR